LLYILCLQVNKKLDPDPEPDLHKVNVDAKHYLRLSLKMIKTFQIFRISLNYPTAPWAHLGHDLGTLSM
jgi:hypothetical protein